MNNANIRGGARAEARHPQHQRGRWDGLPQRGGRGGRGRGLAVQHERHRRGAGMNEHPRGHGFNLAHGQVVQRNEVYQRDVAANDRIPRDRNARNKTNHPRGVHPISYKALEEMMKDDLIEARLIILRLANEGSGFFQRLNQEMDGGMIQLLLKLISKMCSDDEPPDSFLRILSHIMQSKFSDKLIRFLHGLPKARNHQTTTHISNCLDLLMAWLIRIPTSSEMEVSMLASNVRIIATKMRFDQENQIITRLDEIERMIEGQTSRHERIEPDQPSIFTQMHDRDPPNNFRVVSVFPQANDINGLEDQFVRTNLVNSAYKNMEHYLDVQFRLLREDFVRPLREGIRECFTLGEIRLKNQKQTNIKVYEDVSIEFPLPGRTGMQYCIHFNSNRLQRVKWETTRRLMFGNLVCLSSDKFKQHFLFATVADRDPTQLKMGYITLEFVCNNGRVGVEEMDNIRNLLNLDLESDEDEEEEEDAEEEEDPDLSEVAGNSLVSQTDMKKKYYMVETEAYFESYRHVLASLQKIETIPMDRYIVHCHQEMKPPHYLRAQENALQYNFQCILGSSESSERIVEVLNTERWPDADDLSLDPSQVEALKSAITNELAVIQGPPGTGKTHVGLIIMKLLLANSGVRRVTPLQAPWRRVPRTRDTVEHSQILVICFTNHALDQFLEGITAFLTKGIIRVGGRCKTKSLEKFLLRHVRMNHVHTGRSFNRRTIWNLKRDLRQHREAMELHTNILETSTHAILRLKEIREVIPVEMYQQFLSRCGHNCSGDDVLLQWLGVVDPELILYDKPYVVQETLNAVSAPLLKQGFAMNQIIQAIIERNTMQQQEITNWLTENKDSSAPGDVLPSPDIIYSYLDQFEIPFDPQPLLDQGYHPVEIKCALLATDFINLKIEFIENWLRLKTNPTDDLNEDGEKQTADHEQKVVEADDIAFLVEQRAVDQDNVEEKKKANKNKIQQQFAAATYDDIKAKMASSKWELQPGERKRRKNRMKQEIGRVDAMLKADAANVDDIFQVDQNDRWRLYRRWIRDLRDKLRSQVVDDGVKYNQLAKALLDAQNEEDFAILRSAKVVAVTTTGAAKYRDIIQRLPARVVVVEEAAEVLEAHVVTSMPSATEHLILIGDHQQLRPSPTVYELARKFNLEVSLFERMIKNGLPRSRLALQHRMRPAIADLLRPHIYEELFDHESVLRHGDVTGVQKNVYFISHEEEEDNVEDGKSKVNRHEANFLVSLCHYLMQQGYSPSQITILTAYVGQLHVINRIAHTKKLARGVRVTAVDNYQGEENDIILLSLVRSNHEGKIGFLGIENRVCVALSRAKVGLFCIGNFKLLGEKSGLWRNILMRLDNDDCTGDGIPLKCKNHPNRHLFAKTDADFRKVPEGGCGQRCKFRLECGHVCALYCHPYDEEHEKYKCRKPCEKLCSLGHKCQLTCSTKCCCKVKVVKIVPKCGHQQTMECFRNPESFKCTEPCTDILECGHQCLGKCGSTCPTKCNEQVEVLTSCGHSNRVPCHRSRHPIKSDCQQPCDVILQCGHKCKGNCLECEQGRLHTRCKEKCRRVLFCGHVCQENCSSKCPTCKRKCETRCNHSQCGKKCFETCVLCKEQCNRLIPGRGKCSKLCSEPCLESHVDKPCLKKLKCKHSCAGFAGERCPKLCRICDKEKVKEVLEFFGEEEKLDTRYILLECGHCFTSESLDKWMTIKDEDEDVGIHLKECPQCKSVIRRSNRYRHIINQQLTLINQVKEKINGNPDDVIQAKERLKSEVDERRAASGVEQSRKEDWKKLKILIGRSKTLNELVVAEVKLKHWCKIFSVEEKLDTFPPRYSFQHLIQGLNSDIEVLKEWLLKDRPYFSEQEIEDLECQLARLEQQLSLIDMKNNSVFSFNFSIDGVANLALKNRMDEAEKMLFEERFRFEGEHKKNVEDIMTEIKKLAPHLVSGLGITEPEKEMIVKAMSFRKGHWYKCKNNHIYCIGDCGGASESRICPECKDAIGGTRHRLASGNMLASEMDGSTRPAYDPENFYIPPEI